MWLVKTFNNLTLIELEQILRLRQSIFIIEQNSIFQDIDGNDNSAIHIFNKEYDQIWAYVRLIVHDDKIVLGRVTINKEKRGTGKGRDLLNQALQYTAKHFPNKNIEIVAMSYLKEFYWSLGFKTISDVYIMDNHPHEDMILKR